MSGRATFGKVTLYRFEDSLAIGNGSITLDGFTEVKWGSQQVRGQEVRYTLHFKEDAELKPASWYKGFQPLLAGSEHQVPSITMPGFVLLLSIGNSLYAFTGGLGFAPVRKLPVVTHFGLTVARKLVGEEELKGLSQKDTGGNVNHLDRAFRRGYSPAGDSGNLKRILTHLRATMSSQNPRFNAIGRSIIAGDALSVNGQKSFDELLNFAVEVDQLWNLNIPLLAIPQLEEVHQKREQLLVSNLTQTLIAKLANYAPENDSLFIDNEDIGYLPDRVFGYQLLTPGQSQTAHPTSDEFFEDLRGKLVAAGSIHAQEALLQGLKVGLYFDDGHREDVTLMGYICGDVVYQNEVYFVHQGHWYKATQEYLEEIERELNQVPYLSADELGLTPWDKSSYPLEADYNQAQSAYTVLDCYLVRIPHERGGIEFCDLLGEDGNEFRLVHVKKAHGAELRALFAQGDVSSRLFAHSMDFQRRVFASDMDKMPNPKPQETVDALARLEGIPRHRLRVVFAIHDDTPSHQAPDVPTDTATMLKGTLSPFAKVDLLTRVEALRSMGYQVGVTRLRPYPLLDEAH